MRPLRIAARRFRPRLAIRLAAIAAGLLAASGLAGCGGGTGDPPVDGADVTAPARVTDLYVRAANDTSATLTWTAPGDDGATGRAAQYEIRRATAPINAANWDAAALVAAPAPATPGSRETLVVTGLTTGQEWWFALRAADEAPNWSPVSNAPSAHAVSGGGRTWRVRVDGSGDVPTIQAAIDSAAPGDLVLVGDGVYTWTNQGTTSTFGLLAFFNFKHDFTVRSESGPAATIIECEQQGRGVYFQGNSQNSTNITLEGFTVRNGRANAQTVYAGGGMYAHLSACTLRDCVFTDCTALGISTGNAETDSLGSGGGIWYGGVSAPTFERCAFTNNLANVGGGALVINSSGDSYFRDCVFLNNRTQRLADGLGGNGAGFYSVHFRFTLENCLIAGNVASNKGGGVRLLQAVHPSTFRNCTIVDNGAFQGGGILADTLSVVTVESSIIADARNGGGFVRHPAASLTVSCSDTHGNFGGTTLPPGTIDGGGNFSLDPLFCATGSAPDYHLQADSPCAPGHHPSGAACGQIGAFWVGCGAR